MFKKGPIPPLDTYLNVICCCFVSKLMDFMHYDLTKIINILPCLFPFQMQGILESQWDFSSSVSVSAGLTLECQWRMKIGFGTWHVLFSYSFSLKGFGSLPPYLRGLLCRWHSGKQSSCRCREHKRRGFDPWIRKMPCLLLPGEGSGNPLQYSCLENSMDRGTWWASVHGFAKSRHDQVQNSCTLFQLSLSFITPLNVPVFRHTIPG